MRFGWAVFALSGATLVASPAALAAESAVVTSWRFDLGAAATAPGFVGVAASTLYDADRGHGFEPGANLRDCDRGTDDPLTRDSVSGDEHFRFSVAVPEGNYRVTVTVSAVTVVKAETRRLMLEALLHVAPEELVRRTFAVNVRTPALPPGNAIKLNSRETTPGRSTSVTTTWDEKLTLQFSGAAPSVGALELERVEDATTVFLIGDSTVTDQASEPYGTWGQMLPRWFKPGVAIANHAESGETLKAFRAQRRWDKVMLTMKPGDFVFMQFGHNDLNARGHDGIWPREDLLGGWAHTHSEANTDYKWLLAAYAVEVRRRGGTPVIVSPMTKIDLRTGELNAVGLGDYPRAAREAAELADVPFIDLNAWSAEIVTALGPTDAPRAYVDGLHSNSYGGYLFSRAIVEGIRRELPDLAQHLTDDAGQFAPSQPRPLPEAFTVPLEPRPPRPATTPGR